MPGVGEDLVCVPELSQITTVEIGGTLENPGCLLHGMGDDNDRILQAQLIDQFFSLCRGDQP